MSALTGLILEAVMWTVIIILISQIISFTIVAWLGVPPNKIEHEIEEKQNAAVGAIFFIVTLVTTLFVSVLSSNGFTEVESAATGAMWIFGGVAFGTILTFLNIFIVFRWMGQEERAAGESMYRYIQRELIDEHNLAFAFFIGALAVAPYIAVLFQIL